MAELGYTMRRESADNDSLTHMLPYEDHLVNNRFLLLFFQAHTADGLQPIHQIIPWSIGPNGDSWDRIFIQVAADCPVRLCYYLFNTVMIYCKKKDSENVALQSHVTLWIVVACTTHIP